MTKEMWKGPITISQFHIPGRTDQVKHTCGKHCKVTSSNCFLCPTNNPKPKRRFIYIINEEEKLQILTFKMIEQENVWHCCKTAGNEFLCDRLIIVAPLLMNSSFNDVSRVSESEAESHLPFVCHTDSPSYRKQASWESVLTQFSVCASA